MPATCVPATADDPGLGPPPALGRGWAATSPRVRRRWAARRWLVRARRPAGAVLVAVALTLVLAGRTAPEDPSTTVAARDLPAGHRLGPRDLTTAPSTPPDGALDVERATGQVLTGPMRRGEPVTDARVSGPGRLVGAPPGTVAVTLTPSDPAAVNLVSPGDAVQVMAGPESSAMPGEQAAGPAGAAVVVPRAVVLDVPAAGSSGLLETDRPGVTLVLAVTAAQALTLTEVTPTRWVGLAVLPASGHRHAAGSAATAGPRLSDAAPATEAPGTHRRGRQ